MKWGAFTLPRTSGRTRRAPLANIRQGKLRFSAGISTGSRPSTMWCRTLTGSLRAPSPPDTTLLTSFVAARVSSGLFVFGTARCRRRPPGRTPSCQTHATENTGGEPLRCLFRLVSGWLRGRAATSLPLPPQGSPLCSRRPSAGPVQLPAGERSVLPAEQSRLQGPRIRPLRPFRLQGVPARR